MESLIGFFSSWGIFGAIFGLHLLLPARHATGYVASDQTSELLRYRLNGPLVLVVSLGVWAGLGFSGAMPWDWLWHQRWYGFSGAIVLGVLLSIAVVVTEPTGGKSWLAELYQGRRLNPQMFNRRADAKMVLYLLGAVLLELNLLSFAAHHFLTYPNDPSPGVVLYVVLFTWFVCDYLVFERVHLYTYDLFAERIGFKLVWGCLAWYPYFYVVGLWAVADEPNPKSPYGFLMLVTVIFFVGWILARGSNMQKYTFKMDPEREFLRLIKPKQLSNGKQHLLCNGFWGVSRHVNYLGEILMAFGLTLCLGWPFEFAPWLYPLYYLALLIPRQIQDDKRCAAKYGDLWADYCAHVPWRIVPKIY